MVKVVIGIWWCLLSTIGGIPWCNACHQVRNVASLKGNFQCWLHFTFSPSWETFLAALCDLHEYKVYPQNQKCLIYIGKQVSGCVLEACQLHDGIHFQTAYKLYNLQGTKTQWQIVQLYNKNSQTEIIRKCYTCTPLCGRWPNWDHSGYIALVIHFIFLENAVSLMHSTKYHVFIFSIIIFKTYIKYGCTFHKHHVTWCYCLILLYLKFIRPSGSTV